VNPNPSEREMDQLLSIGEQETIAADGDGVARYRSERRQLNRRAGGIFTDKVHTKAKIKTINAAPLEKDLEAGNVIHRGGLPGHQ